MDGVEEVESSEKERETDNTGKANMTASVNKEGTAPVKEEMTTQTSEVKARRMA